MLSIAEAQSLAYEFIQHYPVATQLGFIFGEDARALYGQSASQVPSTTSRGGHVARHEPSMEALWQKIDRSYPDATPDERAEEVFAHICAGGVQAGGVHLRRL